MTCCPSPNARRSWRGGRPRHPARPVTPHERRPASAVAFGRLVPQRPEAGAAYGKRPRVGRCPRAGVTPRWPTRSLSSTRTRNGATRRRDSGAVTCSSGQTSPRRAPDAAATFVAAKRSGKRTWPADESKHARPPRRDAAARAGRARRKSAVVLSTLHLVPERAPIQCLSQINSALR
jgi:hypothetical protein